MTGIWGFLVWRCTALTWSLFNYSLRSGALFSVHACCWLHFTRCWTPTDQVRSRAAVSVAYLFCSFGFFSASGAGRLDVSDVCLSTASFLVQSCGIQLAVFMLKSASHILFQFFDSSFPPDFRPKAAAAMQSLISSAHTHLASPLFTTHLPALSLRLRSWF